MFTPSMTPPIASRRRAIGNEGERKITRASVRARARDFPANYPRPSLRENALSVSILLALFFSPLSLSLSPQHLSSVELAFSATAFFTAHPVESYVPGYPHRRVSSVPSRRRRRCLPLLLGSSRFFFHSLFLVPPPPLPLFLSLRLTRPTLLAILVLPAREERERLARNPPQNKRPSRRSRSRAARACSRARLPFRVFLTIDSLPSPSAKLPADAVRKERARPESGHEEMRLPRALFLFLPVSIRFPFLDLRPSAVRAVSFASARRLRNSLNREIDSMSEKRKVGGGEERRREGAKWG